LAARSGRRRRHVQLPRQGVRAREHPSRHRDHAGITVGYRTPDARIGDIACSFYHGADDAPALQPDQLCLDDVDAVAISEVMADLAFVVSV
jgi:hypothetical protein